MAELLFLGYQVLAIMRNSVKIRQVKDPIKINPTDFLIKKEHKNIILHTTKDNDANCNMFL